MSDFYVRRLQRVRDERDAVDASLQYVQEQLLRQNLTLAITTITTEQLQNAIDDLDATYFIHLFTTFEGMLRQHLAQHHAGISVAEDGRAVWLINRVTQIQKFPISLPLRERVHEVRRYRNFLVHPGGVSPIRIFFTDALARLSKFVDKLPEPH